MPRLSLEKRIDKFRRLCIVGIQHAMRVPGKTCKQYECVVAMFFPSYAEEMRGKGRYKLALSCSLLGRGNHHAWSGTDWASVFEHAERDVRAWILEVERDLDGE